MNKKNIGEAMFPHPKKIFGAVKILVFLALFLYGAVGVFYPPIIPAEITALVPSEISFFGAAVLTRENIIMISALVSLILAFVLMRKSNNSLR